MAKAKDVASVLSFEKKLVPSDGYLYETTWDNRTEYTPLSVQEKSVRGTISNRLKSAVKNDPAKLDAEVEKPNLQTVDACALSTNQDTLVHYFTLKVLGGVERPSACNNAQFKSSYREAAQKYIEKYGFQDLARRYAINLANARCLWRNRIGTEKIEVQVRLVDEDKGQRWTFDAKQYSIRHFDYEDQNLNELSDHIAKALAGGDTHLLLEVTTYAKLGNAQEVYPSEELVLDKGKGKKSKILYQVRGHAAMHSQKVGNALRTIDTWYPAFGDETASAGPIAIEPYGAVTNLGTAFRTPKDKKDFYSYFDKWARGTELTNEVDEHYVMAVLIRGGVFGESDK